MDKGQQIRYSEAEKSLIKRTFEDEKVLFALRNHFWQIGTDAEKALLSFSPEQLVIIKKVMLPDIEREVPLGQQVDYTHDPLLNTLAQIPPQLACILMDANDLRLDYLTQQFNQLVNGNFELGEIQLKVMKGKLGTDQDEQRHINMLAYKSIKDYIDGRIFEFQYFANPPKEKTEEEKKEIAEKNSSK